MAKSLSLTSNSKQESITRTRSHKLCRRKKNSVLRIIWYRICKSWTAKCIKKLKPKLRMSKMLCISVRPLKRTRLMRALSSLVHKIEILPRCKRTKIIWTPSKYLVVIRNLSDLLTCLMMKSSSFQAVTIAASESGTTTARKHSTF